MSTPILTTKLYIPPLRPKIIPRPRLITQLNAGLHGKLSLISASAGFGKTTLVTARVAQSTRPVAWLALDDGDSDRKIGTMMAKVIQDDLTLLADLLASGTVKSVIDQCYPLDETADALRYLETGRARGKVIISIVEDGGR